jgi:hypothetical protein
MTIHAIVPVDSSVLTVKDMFAIHHLLAITMVLAYKYLMIVLATGATVYLDIQVLIVLMR